MRFAQNSLVSDVIREADHRIANSLSSVAGYMKFQLSRCDDAALTPAQARKILEDASARINVIARLHRRLSLRTSERVDVAGLLSDVCTALDFSLSSGQRFAINVLAKDCFLPVERALPVALIATELITNSIKYSHPSGVAGNIVVSCTTEGADLTLVVADDGIGLPDGSDPTTLVGTGMRVLRALADGLGARLSFRSTPLGLRVEVTIPV